MVVPSWMPTSPSTCAWGAWSCFAWHKMNSVEAELLPPGTGRRFRFHPRRPSRPHCSLLPR
jgi:hypothetical protein